MVHGEPPRVSPALELTIYRVVQEALTNFLKHAGPTATAVVTLAYGSTEILVEIVDNGPGPGQGTTCLLYTSPSPRDRTRLRMPYSA